MAEFRGKGIVSRVREELTYVLSEKKACVVITQNVVEDEDFAKQFSDTARLYGKVPKGGEITCHAFVLSPAPEDGATVERLAAYTKDVTELLFSEYQVVAAVHGDSGILHSHIVVNAVNFVTGDKLNVSMATIRKMRDAVDDLGLFYGFSPRDPARPAEMFRYQVSELREMWTGRHDWRWDVRELVREACLLEFTEGGFRERMKRCVADVTDSKDGTDFVFHTVNSKGEPRHVAGSSLGAYFSKTEILRRLETNRLMYPDALSEGEAAGLAAASGAWSAQAFSGKLEGPWPEAPEILSSHLVIIPSFQRRRVDLSGFSSAYDLDADTVTDLWYNRMLDDIEKMSKYGSAFLPEIEPMCVFVSWLRSIGLGEIRREEDESERTHGAADPPAGHAEAKKVPLRAEDVNRVFSGDFRYLRARRDIEELINAVKLKEQLEWGERFMPGSDYWKKKDGPRTEDAETEKESPSAAIAEETEAASFGEKPVCDAEKTEDVSFAEAPSAEAPSAEKAPDETHAAGGIPLSAEAPSSMSEEKILEPVPAAPAAPDLSRRRVDLSGFRSLAELDADTVADLYYNRQLDDMEEDLLKSPRDARYAPISIFVAELRGKTLAEIRSEEEESERTHPVTDPPARNGDGTPLGLSRTGDGPSLTDLRGDRFEDAVARLDEIIREAVKKAESEKKPGIGEKILGGLKAAFSGAGRALSGLTKKAPAPDAKKATDNAAGEKKKSATAEAETHDKTSAVEEYSAGKDAGSVPERAAGETSVSAESVSSAAPEKAPLPEVAAEAFTMPSKERIAAIIEAGRARAERENKAYVKMLNDYRADVDMCRETHEDVLTLSEYQQLSEEEREERAFRVEVWRATVKLGDVRRLGSIFSFNLYTMYDIWADYARHELDQGRLFMYPGEYVTAVDGLLDENGGSVEKVREKIRFNPPSEFIPAATGERKAERDEMLLRLHNGVSTDRYFDRLSGPLYRERDALEREMKKAERERGGNQRYKDGK